jgi:ABC-type iron transport system FetAB permease component
LILATAATAFSKAGIAAASSLSACSFSIVIVFFCLTQASVTPATSAALISAFLFSTSSSLRSAAV